MRTKKQMEFVGLDKPKAVFGGSLLKGNPKCKRPLDSKLPILLTLRAVKSGMRHPKAFGPIQKTVERCSAKYGVRIYEWANVGNHLHLLIKIGSRAAWVGFIRELTGEIASIVRSLFNIEGGFWMFRPHTRIVQGWKKAYRFAKSYVVINQLEAEGLANRKEIRALRELRAVWADG
jgi:REP element-mobilizing transposase RayT